MDVKKLQDSGRIIFEVIAGSHSYGTATPQSDTDIRGIFVQPLQERLSLNSRVDEINDEKQDTKYFELHKFVDLALKCNPNIIELLWTPEDCIQVCKPAMHMLLDNRNLFVSKLAFSTFSGYAHAQIKKARGQNKWVNNPQPETMPVKEDFCWYIPMQDGLRFVSGSQVEFPCRPIPFRETRLPLSECHAASLEHSSNIYRLYHYGQSAKGIFRGDDTLVCESISKPDEPVKFIGLLIYNKDLWDKSLRDWHHYWDWKNNRNDARWVDQEGGKVDFDQKNMSHCMRLLLSGEHILKHGEPIVRFEGAQLQHLRDIRANKLSYTEIMADVERRMKALYQLKQESPLPDVPDVETINNLWLGMAQASSLY